MQFTRHLPGAPCRRSFALQIFNKKKCGSNILTATRHGPCPCRGARNKNTNERYHLPRYQHLAMASERAGI